MSASALAMSVSDPDGSTHPNAVYLPGTVTMDNLDRTGGVDWVPYHDIASFLAGNAPIAGVSHHTALGPALYAAVVSFPLPAGATTYGQVTAAALMYLAMNVKDVPGKNADGTPMIDPATGQPVLVSYFASATVVSLG